MDSPRTRMYTHPFFEATPPGAAPGPPVKNRVPVFATSGGVINPESKQPLDSFQEYWVCRSGARSATTAGASAPPEARRTSGATNHDERSWFACNGFSACGERSIRLLLREIKFSSGARSATTAGASAPPEVRSTSGATDHDERSWFAFSGFSVS